MGAVWIKLKLDIERDTEEAYRVTKSFWKCMAVSLLSKRLHPLKYYDTSGKSAQGYAGIVMQLANMPTGGTPWRDAMLKEWGHSTWDQHVNQIWGTINLLKEREAEYRNAANIVLQVGIGWGGMILGVIGLLLGVLGIGLSLLPMLLHK